ncbi:GNAT family N-acetyltransferase [Bacillus solimangrovi]|uniref:N-acetyltransferase domain-containing protein n=1 Tax=Bacillus solimangrovi TaxID=1305675 RepID=A0A1E5LJE0_9BACI|nr:GNAT family N-acetyltransferase [Bacillus solimangrovi]OEH94181.1 hypothetical protein BFG57_09015 [Bacillus solimangrovi]
MIRVFQQEDRDYVINSHYEIYNQEYQYDLSFRDFIENSVDGFVERSSDDERIWIVENEGQPRGSISIKKVDDHVAQLGLFLVEPVLRGTGYGQRLVQTAIDFCKERGYKSIILWTNSDLVAARRIYEKYGFHLEQTRTTVLSNQTLVEERWEMSI